MKKCMADLKTGEKGMLTGYSKKSKVYRQKLLAMGLTKGTKFTVIRMAPLGDPVEISVRGFKLSLRKNEAAALIVKGGLS
jgi:ferrous iron transport protein A